MTHPLLVWLEERIAEAERIALAAEEKAVSPWTFNDMGDVADAHHEEVLPTDGGYYGQGEAVAEHVALHDPRSVLALVEAHRQLLAIHQPDGDAANPECQSCAYTFASKTGRGSEEWEDIELLYEDWPCPTVRALASAYRNSPGWQSDWGPT